MAKKRLIPKLQLLPSKLIPGSMSLVTTQNFKNSIEVGDPVSQAKIYEAQAVDELVFVDLSYSRGVGSKEAIVNVIRKAAEEIFLPITIGGGVRLLQDFSLLLNNGADKVSINSAALEDPKLISDAARQFGSQCVVVSIDYKKDENGSFRVYSEGGSKKSNLTPLDWALKAQNLGAGELLVTCIDHDGTKQGLELEMTERICQSISVPVIISGGCGRAIHFTDGFRQTKAEAIAAGTFFCFQDQSPMQTRSHIKNAGIPIRIHT